MSKTACDAIVVGTGIVGAACACELSRRGLRIIIIGSEAIASGATAVGMGHIVVMDDSSAQFALTRYSQKLWHQLRPELPDDVEYEQRGTIWVAADEEEMNAVLRKHKYLTSRDVPSEILDPQQLQLAEPNLRSGLAGGLLVPEDIVLDPPNATRFLMRRAEEQGAKIHLGVGAQAMGNGVVRLRDGSEFAAPVLVNAAGTSSPDLTPGIEVRKRKGHLALTAPHPGFLRHQLVELGYLKSAHSSTTDSVAFNVQPRRNGQVLIGSSRQYGAEHPEEDRDMLERMLQRAQHYMPGLAHLPAVSTRAGFRPASADNLPLIGPWPGDKSIFVATGHEGLGITTSLATGRILADQITGTASEIPVEPYWPSRNRRTE